MPTNSASSAGVPPITLEAHGWNWTAWDFHPAAGPTLIADWNYAPTPDFGVWVKQALAKNRDK